MKRIVLGLIVVLVVLILASVSIDVGRTVAVTDERSVAVESVYIVYHHEGHRLNPCIR
jgi:hypothetical protein